MKLLLTYAGIISTLFGAMAGLNKILPNMQSGTKQQQVETATQQIQEIPTSSEAPTPEIKSEPIKPVAPKPVVKTQPKPVKKDNSDYYKDSDKEFAEINALINKPIPKFVPAPTPKPTVPIIDYSAIAAKKQANCKKIANQCMADIGSKIMQYSGSAHDAMARTLGEDCNSQYQKCIR